MEQKLHLLISWVESVHFDGRMQINLIVVQLYMFLAKINIVFLPINLGSNPIMFVDHQFKVDLIPLTRGKIKPF
jgi:hypothetical protein